MKNIRTNASNINREEWEIFLISFKSNLNPPESSIFKWLNKVSFAHDKFTINYLHSFKELINIYVSSNFETITGYDAKLSLTVPSFIMSIVHKDDLPKLFIKAKMAFDYLQTCTPVEIQNAVMRFNYRIVKPDGSLIRVIDTVSVVELDSENKFSLGLGFMIDVTKISPDFEGVMGELQLADNQQIHLDTHSHVELFSKRELEILNLIAQGLSSKQISAKLHISINTVHNHRQNMMQKHNCHNIIEVLQLYDSIKL